MEEKPDCTICRQLKAEHGKEPECWKCMPELLRSNYDAWQVWLMVQGQLILAPNGHAVDVNHMAVWKLIEMYDVEDPLWTFERVTATFRALFKKSIEETRLGKDLEAW